MNRNLLRDPVSWIPMMGMGSCDQFRWRLQSIFYRQSSWISFHNHHTTPPTRKGSPSGTHRTLQLLNWLCGRPTAQEFDGRLYWYLWWYFSQSSPTSAQEIIWEDRKMCTSPETTGSVDHQLPLKATARNIWFLEVIFKFRGRRFAIVYQDDYRSSLLLLHCCYFTVLSLHFVILVNDNWALMPILHSNFLLLLRTSANSNKNFTYIGVNNLSTEIR